MKKIFLFVLLGVWSLSLRAQDDAPTPAPGGGYAPRSGNLQANLLLGKGFFYTSTDYILQIPQNATAVGGSLTTDLPGYLTLSDPNGSSLANMAGVEVKYFIADQLAVSLSGAGYINNTPWREAVDATTAEVIPPDDSDPQTVTVLPKYANIDAQLKTRVVVNAGGQYYFRVGNERIHPYGGVLGTFQFAGLSAQSTYSGASPNEMESDKRDAGARTGQLLGWALSAVAGVEYSLLPGLTVGFEIKPVSYYYSGLSLFAQPGLAAMTGENQDYVIFGQPLFKIGFRF
ncbi:MAG: hypothetical protein LBK18_07250 [Prevotellaceae bacterium]|jgi:hypothetical protein|nr:hypothetical protein [Prevotellaceae bacterium]